MRLFLIRHGETVHNVGQIWYGSQSRKILSSLIPARAGTIDSALTNHGMMQIECLARHFARLTPFSDVFASDLSRARITAEAICRNQLVTPVLSKNLREKDIGSLEGVRWSSFHPAVRGSNGSTETNTSSAYVEPESDASLRRRANSFLHEHLLPLLFDSEDDEKVVAIVSHGIILRILWVCLAQLFNPLDIAPWPAMPSWDGNMTTLFTPAWSWSNTGFMSLLLRPSQRLLQGLAESNEPEDAHTTAVAAELEIDSRLRNTHPPTALLHGWSLTILAIDCKEHLVGLRRTRGGIGSAAHDSGQQKIDQYFR